MNNLVIRKANMEDAQKIIDFLNQVGGESDNLLFGFNEFKMSIEQEQSFIETMNNAEKDLMLLGVVEEELVAIGSLQGYKRTRIEHRGQIAISVSKKYWHCGIGSRMMKELIEFAKDSASMSVVELTVKSDNKNAIALYEKLGFEQIGLYKKFFKIENEYFDAYFMNLYL